ncbi:MAG: hypothetical protein ACXWQJ_14105 [Bdellovibrionota bacterium]
MDWKTVANGMFAFGWSCIFVYVARSLNRLTDSVGELNTNVAVVIERVAGHEHDISELKRRVEKVEDR